MKIVHIICSLNTGGAELMLIDLARCQAKLGHSVSIIVTNDSYEQALVDSIDSQVQVRLIHRPEGSHNPLHLLRLYLAIKRLCPDVIHFHNDSAAKIAGLLKKTVCVGTVHCPGINICNYTKINQIFSISQAVADDLKLRQEIKSKIILNGINFDAIKKEQTTYNPGEPFRIVQTGRMQCNIKGQDTITKAIAILTDRGYNVLLDLIGDPIDETTIRKLSAELSVADRIHILGRKSRDEIYENLCSYHLGVLPSRYEGFGLSLIEYMAAKIPVVATNVDGPAEILKENQYGLLCKPDDPEDLARMIAKVIDNYAMYSANAHSNAFEYAKKNFGIDATAAHYVKEYQRLLNKNI